MLKFPNIDPVIISVGPLGVTWYSLSYVVGIMLGWYYVLDIAKKKQANILKKNIDDFVSWVIIGIIVGGRLGYVLFYDPAKYFSNPIEILKTYEGGMSFHGGISGFIISSFIFCRYYKIYYWTLADICAAAAPIGLFFGRIANFINAELYGRVTDVAWGVIFPYSDMQPRHPSQLYESFLEGLVLFFILKYLVFKQNALKKPGFLSGIFLIFYALFRIIIEFFREPDEKIGYIFHYFTMGQLLCIPMIIIGLILIYNSSKQWQLTQK